MPFKPGFSTEWLGRFQSIRDVYFKERTPERVKELEHLINDAEYLISELSRLEKRSCTPSLVSVQLRNLTMQLMYWERRKDFKSSRATIMMIAERFNVTITVVMLTIYDPTIKDAWWLTETEGGKELDIYIPPDEVYHPSNKFRFKGKKFEFLTKKQLIWCIEELSHRLEAKKLKEEK